MPASLLFTEKTLALGKNYSVLEQKTFPRPGPCKRKLTFTLDQCRKVSSSLGPWKKRNFLGLFHFPDQHRLELAGEC